MAQGIIFLIRAYQFWISPLFGVGAHCRFYPSCSFYSQTAVDRFGVFRGGFLAIQRLLRCNPWCVGGEDQVPDK